MYADRVLKAAADMSAIDVLLMRVAVRIQLPPHLYKRACDRFETIREWVIRENSEIAPFIEDFYVQGSFDLGATILQAKDSRANDGFDIDSMLQIVLRSEEETPDDVLELLFQSIRGEPGSRYYEKAHRRARCITIDYAELHFDITPTVLLAKFTPKTGLVFEAKPDGPRDKDQIVLANPYGFGVWFKETVGAGGLFGEVFESASIAYDRALLEEHGETASDVPDQVEAYRKPLAVIALQLLKRWRYVTYDRSKEDVKLPPSVLLAYFAASSTGRSDSLFGELRSLAEFIISELSGCIKEGRLLDVRNPRCEEDRLTDRWPRNSDDQDFLLNSLEDLVKQLDALPNQSLAEQREVLTQLFGDGPGSSAVESIINDRTIANREAGPLTLTGRAAIPIGLGTNTVAPSGVRSAPQHRYFGDPE